MKTAPRKPQYGRWSCLWSSGCHARQARPTHQKRNTYCTFGFFDNMPSCMSYWMVPWAGVVESQFSIIKNDMNCTSKTAIWALVVPLVVCVRCKAGTTNPPKTQSVLHFLLLREYRVLHELLNCTLTWRVCKSVFPYKKQWKLHLRDRNMNVGRAFGRGVPSQGRHDQPTKNEKNNTNQ